MFKHQIRNGHNPNGRVPFFDAPTAAIFPMRTVTYMGREVKVPNDVDVVLSTLHGDQWPVDCRPSWSHAHKTSFGTHRHGRPGKDYALSFPCRLMPKAYHGDFMDGRGLERFGYPRSSLLPPVTKAPALLINTTQQLYEYDVLHDVMSVAENRALQVMLDDLAARMKEIHVQYVLAFGSLMGFARSAMHFPWDDDTDFMVHKSDLQKLISGLTRVKTGPWCQNGDTDTPIETLHKWGRCANFKLSEHTMIAYKPWGMPIKITPTHSVFPCIDFNTWFLKDNGRTVEVPRQELAHGHIPSFSVGVDAWYPLWNASFMNVSVFLPHNIDAVLTTTYGSDWPSNCQVAFNHRQSQQFYTNASFPGNENVNANAHPSARFDCSILPSHFQRGVHANGKHLERYDTR